MKCTCLLFALVLWVAVFSCQVEGSLGSKIGAIQFRSKDKFVTFRLLTRATASRPEVIDSRWKQPFKTFQPGKPVKVVVHGWRGHDNCTFSRTMKEAIFPQLDINLVMVDWSGHGSTSKIYPLARAEVPRVGLIVAEFLDFFVTAHRLSLKDLHVIGHSLGGQIVGIAGRNVKSGKIGRITGSDPAGPMFSVNDRAGRLSTDSAEFVDVIHTTANYLGFGEPIGHVDFFPNSGHATQPGCGLDTTGQCSHRRAYCLLQESIKRPDAFPAVACKSWEHFTKNDCQNNNIVPMGWNTPKTARGLYFLQTNAATPFGKKSAGARETLDRPEIVDSRQVEEFKNLKPEKEVKIIIHGWKGYTNCKFFKVMKSALLPSFDINLIMVDWSRHGSLEKDYSGARVQVPEVSRLVAEFLDFLQTNQNIELSDTHLIGHSLGGHIAGIAGRTVNGTVARVTGSDPAGRMFSVEDKAGRLSTDSAEFVDVIHTTANYLGFGEPIGHVDFFPNSGHVAQPGCGMDFKGSCSHKRAFYFLQESFTDQTAFPAVACRSWDDFKKSNCHTNNVAYLGLNTEKTVRGVYFMQTNKKSPYGRGWAGTKYSR